MKIKGIAVKTTPDFVRTKHGDNYNKWLNSLPEESRNIILSGVYATNWYPLTEAVIIPTQKVGDIFYEGDHVEAAKDLGRFSSEVALKGIYKLFIKVSSPHFVLSRASSIFSAYYDPSEIDVLEKKDKKAVLRFSGFDEKDKLIIYRISGWIEKTLDITLKKAINIDVSSKVVDSKCIFNMTILWE